VGNVLGTAGYHTNYSSEAPNGTGSTCHKSVFALGWGGNCSNGGIIPNDPLVAATIMRWGNYDTVTQSARFVASEVPSGLSKYANPVPGNQTLPASLYLSARPYWWPASTPWPAIGPDVTGGDDPNVAGHAYSIPAKTCYKSLPIDSAYARSYTVSNASWSGGTVTVTVGAHTAVVGQSIQVSGVSPAAYNGAFLVFATTSTTISYGMLTSPGAYASGGAIKTPDILLFNSNACYASSPNAPRAPTSLRIIR
jgi:hypothetical protein